tara:strand:+ start:162 stop:284 length:123 start_codon:yes stop_codon:yes gene_type:complete
MIDERNPEDNLIERKLKDVQLVGNLKSFLENCIVKDKREI